MRLLVSLEPRWARFPNRSPMHEYLSLMPAVRRAVADRGDALLEWRRSAAETEVKKTRLARLETDITKMLQVDLLKREVAEATVAAERARGEYETVKARHVDEFSRLEKSGARRSRGCGSPSRARGGARRARRAGVARGRGGPGREPEGGGDGRADARARAASP